MVWPRSITLREAKLLAICDVPVPPDTRLLAGWVLSAGGLLVAPVPAVGTVPFARAVHRFREGLTSEGRADTSPTYL